MKTDFSNNEWLSKFLYWTRLSPLGVFLGMLAINLIVNIPIALKLGAWESSNQTLVGLKFEPSAWLNDWLAIPVIIAYFHWIQTASGNLFGNLLGEGIYENLEATKKDLETSRKRFQSIWAIFLSIVIGLVFAAWFVITFTQPVKPSEFASWVTVNPIIVWVRAPFMFIVAYALTYLLYDLIIVIITLNGLFQNGKIHVDFSL